MSLRRTLALVATLALAIACSTPEERFAKHLERANAHSEAGRIDDALIELQSALKIDPENADVNQQLAELLRSRGTLQAAAFHFGEAYRLDPSRLDAGLAQAELLATTAPQRSGQLIDQAMAAHPEDPRVYRSQSRRAAQAGNIELALSAAHRATELAPDDPDSWSQLGSAYVAAIRARRGTDAEPSEENFTRGLEAFQKTDDLLGGHVGARLERARIYGLWHGHQEDAIAAYRSAIALAQERGGDSGVAFAAMRLARYAARIENIPLRIEALEKMVEVSPERVQLWSELAQASAWSNGPEAGLAVYQRLIESQPESAVAHTLYTDFLAQRGQELDAIAHLDRVITDGVDEPILWEQLVRLELAERRLADARASLEEMQGRHSDEPATGRATARLAIHEQRYADAIAALDALGGKAAPEIERLRATAELGAGRLDRALAAIMRAAGAAPGDATTLRLKARIEDESKDHEAVLATFEQLEKNGQILTPLENATRARNLYQVGRSEEGRALLVEVLEGPYAPPIAAVEYAQREGEGDPAQAHAYLQKTLRLMPGNFSALQAITELEIQANQAASALARLDKLVESQLAGSQVLLLRARILAAAGQLDRAEADALRAFEASPELDGAVDVLFGIYASQNKIDEALASFEEADTVGVLHSGARVLLGRLYLSKGDTAKAKATYEKVIEENPTSISAKSDLAYLLASTGEDLDRALSLAEDAQKAKPRDPRVAETVGFIYLKKGRHEVALQQFRYAIEVGESQGVTSPAVHYHLGVALAEIGREAEAKAAFERALRIDPDFGEASDARRRIGASPSSREAS